MAKIKRIGSKKEILKKKQASSQIESLLSAIAARDEKELDQWVKDHFSTLSEDAYKGIESLTKALWANTQVTKMLWQRQ